MQHKSQPRATSTETKKNAHRFKDKGSKAKTTNKVISNAFNNTIAKEEGFTQSVTTPLLSTNLLLFQK